MSNTSKGGEEICLIWARAGETDLEYRDCVGEADGVRLIVVEKSQDSAVRLVMREGCLRLS
jgi:hypothetical protein